MYQTVSYFSSLAIPAFISLILVSGFMRKVPIYESFIEGAKEGFDTAVSIIPNLVGMLVAIEVFKASGTLDFLIQALDPLLEAFAIPGEILPLAILRPITGTGALAVMTEIFKTHGPDSYLGRLASVMQGSTDTTLYILTVYFGSVGIRRYRYALKIGLFSDLAGILASLAIVNWIFGR